MPTKSRSGSPWLSLALWGLFAWAPLCAQGNQIWGQFVAFLGGTTTSQIVGNPASDFEAADDFHLTGTVNAVTISGNVCYQCTPLPPSFGAWVRFYTDQLGRPGNLQYEAFVPSVLNLQSLQIQATLPTPFAATGRHWVSFQIATPGPHGFGWGVSNPGNVVNNPAQRRSRTPSGPWQSLASTPGGSTPVDLAFTLHGTLVTSPIPVGLDPCGAWTFQDLPLPPGATAAAISDIVIRDSFDAWAVGNWQGGSLFAPVGGPATWHWDGSSWQWVPFPNPMLSNAPVLLTSVPTTPTRLVLAAGSREAQSASLFLGRQPLIASWDGTAWIIDPTTPVSANNGSEIHDIAVVGNNDVWFVGSWIEPGCTGGLAWRWNGSSYSAYPLPCTGLPGAGGDFEIVAADALPDGRVYALRGGEGADPTPIPQLLRFDGSTWNLIASPTFGYTEFSLGGLDVLPDGTVWIGGSATSPVALGGTTLRPFAMRFDGSNFVEWPVPAGSGMPAASTPDLVHFASGSVAVYNGISGVRLTDFAAFGELGLGTLPALGPCHLVAAGGRRATSTSPTTPVVAWRRDGCSAVTYGPAQPGALDLSWIPGTPSTSGNITLSGGPPSSPALLGVSVAPSSLPLPSGDLLIDLSPGAWFGVPLTLDALGTASLPVSLQSPALAGTTFFLQAALGPGVPLLHSRALLLRLCG